jgi:hypothetical protein
MISSFPDFIKCCEHIAAKNAFVSDWFGGIGLGFLDNKLVMKKLYFNFEKNINLNTFPLAEVRDLYARYIENIDSSRCAFNSIAIKKDISGNHTNYFHLKFKPEFKFSNKDKILNINLSDVKKGLSVECDSDNVFIKRYYYLNDKSHISSLLKLFKINEDPDKINYIEYTHNPKKIILIYANVDNVFNGIENNFSNQILEEVYSIKNIYKVEPCLFGKYLLGNKSAIYWDLYKDKFNLINVVL